MDNAHFDAVRIKFAATPAQDAIYEAQKYLCGVPQQHDVTMTSLQSATAPSISWHLFYWVICPPEVMRPASGHAAAHPAFMTS
jgi:hypothetical protein